MDFEEYLKDSFLLWKPECPDVISRTKYSVELSWKQASEPFGFLEGHLLYKVQRKDKIPAWTTVYSGGKTTKFIGNLAPTHPYKFRLQVILKATSVSKLQELILEHYGDNKVYEIFKTLSCFVKPKVEKQTTSEGQAKIDTIKNTKLEICEDDATKSNLEFNNRVNESKGTLEQEEYNMAKVVNVTDNQKPWLESTWSDETWTSTEYAGASAGCFCMAVRCGYLKQVQQMLEIRPELIRVVNPTNGLTALATAVRKGDINMVRYLLDAGADVNLRSITEQTPLHQAVFYGHMPIVDLLLEYGADIKACDVNGLRVVHFAVDSGLPEMLQHVLARGADVHATDSNGWTPLFRAVVQGAATRIAEVLVGAGAEAAVVDRAGLTLPAAARVLAARGGRRESLLRLVDAQFAHDKAVAHFSRLTKKIASVQSLLKLPAGGGRF